MKPITTKDKVKAINTRFPKIKYQYDSDGRIFEIGHMGEIIYVSEREINRVYNACFRAGIAQKPNFKKRVNRINRRKEKVLSKDEDIADNLVGVVHRGDIWDIT